MLKSEYIGKIKKDKVLMCRIMLATGKTQTTIERWVNKKHVYLTQACVIAEICDHLSVKPDEVLEPHKRQLV